jgi:hypothetical protein
MSNAPQFNLGKEDYQIQQHHLQNADNISFEDARDIASMLGMLSKEVNNVSKEMSFDENYYDANEQRMKLDPRRIVESTYNTLVSKVKPNGNIPSNKPIPQQIPKPEPKKDDNQMEFNFEGNSNVQKMSDFQVSEILNRISKSEDEMFIRFQKLETRQNEIFQKLECVEKSIQDFLSGDVGCHEVDIDSSFLMEEQA